ncbi:serine hydrolase [Nocardia iowensis]|uniref:Class A beta-lactamase-related serine hydrolase n=1 Tax=Nocardia iowensis TaxID=204891 RepID=A0ABX8RXG8_NOCIO|nr:serine hydrolase [Nocardia iowensis]QXN94353.1 class A beta-lactamase-related serine hydrolase [Nocardia iowensis]
MAQILRAAREDLDSAGLRGSFLVRDLDSGDELGIDAEAEYPSASLVKVPLAVVTLERIARGELDPVTPIVVQPGRVTAPGPVGVTKFRHPATIALEDLLYLTLSISDNAAADALFGLTPPEAVAAELTRLGVEGISVRHLLDELTRTPTEMLAPEHAHLAHTLAITATTAGHGHPVPQLDISRANTGSARAFVELLHKIWRPSSIRPAAAAQVRRLMGENMLRNRLAPDFSCDASRWSSKTGTLINLRHEIGVVEHADGQVFAVAALTESRVPAAAQPAAEAVMARVARRLRDELRRM